MFKWWVMEEDGRVREPVTVCFSWSRETVLDFPGGMWVVAVLVHRKNLEMGVWVRDPAFRARESR